MDAIGPYRIRGELGRGGAGVVYRGHDPRLGRDVAIKMLLQVDASATQLRRFDREGRALARVRHPNVVAVHEVAHDSGRPYLVMDFVAGESLADRLARSGPLPPGEAARVAHKIADGLAAAHAQGILHRDVKPENVILTADGEPHLTDFGLAKDLSSSETSISIRGRYVGTPGFWSPEQASGDEARMGPATDVYGVGATLFAMLTGRAVFETERLAEAIVAALSRPAPAPSEVREGVPAELDEVALRCLEKEPRDRYRDGGELAEALGRFLRGEPIAPVSTRGRLLRLDADRSASPTGGAGLASRRSVSIGLVAGVTGAAVGVALTLGLRSVDGPGEARLVELQADVARLEGRLRAARAANLDLERRIAAGDRASADPVDPTVGAGDPTDVEGPSAVAEEAERLIAEGIGRLRRRDVAGAASCFDRAVELAPESVDAWTYRASHRMMQGDSVGAIADFGRVLELDPDDVVARANRAAIKGKLGDLAGALADLDEALERDPSSIEALSNRASVRVAAGDETGVIADCDRIIALKPGDALAWSRRGTARKGLGDLAGALVDYDRAIELDPNDGDVWMNRGIVKKQLGDGAGSRADYDAALERGPTPLRCYNRGLLRQERGDLEGALADYGRAIELDPSYAAALVNRGNVKGSQGDLEGALVDYARAIDVEPRTANAWLGRAAALSALDRSDEALAAFDRAIELDPGFPTAWTLRAALRRDRGDLSGAIADLEEHLRRWPDDASALGAREELALLKGVSEGRGSDAAPARNAGATGDEVERRLAAARAKQNGDPAGAVAELDAAIALAPEDRRLWAFRGWIHQTRGELRAAIADFEKVSELGGGAGPEGQLRVLRGWLANECIGDSIRKRGAGDLEGSFAAANEAVEVAPGHGRAWAARAAAEAARGRFDAAFADATRAVEVGSDDVHCWLNRALIARTIGRVDLAIDDLTKAIELDPKSPLAWANRGLVRRENGDRKAALADFETAVRLGHPDTETLRGSIAELERELGSR